MNFTSNNFFFKCRKNHILSFSLVPHIFPASLLWSLLSLHFITPFIICLLHLIFNLLIPSCVAVCLIYRTVFLRVPISRFTLFHTCSPCTRKIRDFFFLKDNKKKIMSVCISICVFHCLSVLYCVQMHASFSQNIISSTFVNTSFIITW